MNNYIYEDIRSKITVTNEQNDGVFRRWTWTGFESKGEADFFARRWEEWIGWGYSPLAYSRLVDGSYVVDARIAKSCD